MVEDGTKLKDVIKISFIRRVMLLWQNGSNQLMSTEIGTIILRDCVLILSRELQARLLLLIPL